MGDGLERRIAELERRAVRLAQRADRVGVGIAETRAGLIVRRVAPIVPPSGTPGISVPCCPDRGLPSTLKLRFPDGVLLDLTWIGNRWDGVRTLNGLDFTWRLFCQFNATPSPGNYWQFRGNFPSSLQAYSFSPIQPSPGVCSPLNLAFTLQFGAVGYPFVRGDQFLVYES